MYALVNNIYSRTRGGVWSFTGWTTSDEWQMVIWRRAVLLISIAKGVWTLFVKSIIARWSKRVLVTCGVTRTVSLSETPKCWNVRRRLSVLPFFLSSFELSTLPLIRLSQPINETHENTNRELYVLLLLRSSWLILSKRQNSKRQTGWWVSEWVSEWVSVGEIPEVSSAQWVSESVSHSLTASHS